MNRLFSKALLLTLLSGFLPLLAQQVVDRIAAVVGEEIILESDINALLMQYSAQAKIDLRDEALFKDLKTRFLKNLIDEKVLLLKAREDTIAADQDRVDQVLDQQVNMLISRAGSQQQLEDVYQAPLPRIKRDLRKQIETRFVIDQLRQIRFASVQVSRREVEQFYKSYKDSLPESRASVNISHILRQIRPSEESQNKALEAIEAIQERLEGGEDFAALAKEVSQGPSAPKGGDIGWVNRTDVVTEYGEAAFALEAGEISDIVLSQFGYHIIQLIERQGERIHTRHILIQLQPTQEDEQRVISQLNDIRQKVLDNEKTFEEMALEFSDDPNVEQDKGTLGDYSIGSFQVQAFEQAVQGLNVGEISQPFKTEFGYHILKLNSRKEASKLTLEKNWQEIEQFAIEQKSGREFEKWLSKLRKEVPINVKIDI